MISEDRARALLQDLADGVPGPERQIPPTMVTRARRRVALSVSSIAVVVAVTAVGVGVGGARLLASGDEGRPANPPTATAPSPTATAPSPTASPGAPVPIRRTFTSSLYGYTIGVPKGWVHDRATRELGDREVPMLVSPAVDTISGAEGTVIVAAQPTGKITDLAGWAAKVDGVVHLAGCIPGPTERIVVDGEPARIQHLGICSGLHHEWVAVVHGSRAYHIVWVHSPGTEEADNALFARILDTFSFAS